MNKRTLGRICRVGASGAALCFAAGVMLISPVPAWAQGMTDAEAIEASQDGASPLMFKADRADIPLVTPGDFSDEMECAVRSGLPNFFAKVSCGEDVTVAFVGGSITQGDWCYRLQTSRYMENRWQDSGFTWINAGVSGTGTDLGAFRIGEQVLKYNPDLVFVEFAVNGAYAEGMEGIIRKIISSNPDTDICLLYAIKTGQTADYLNGSVPETVERLDKVAEHYGIPAIHLGMEAARLEKDGKLLWKGNAKAAGEKILFSADGLHPSKEGGNLYAAAIARGLEKMSAAGLAPKAHSLPAEPLYGTDWDDACMYAPTEIAGYDGNWKPVRTSEKAELKKFSGWFDTVLTSGRKESYFWFAFEGDMFGFFDIGGPEAGQLEILVDGELVKLKNAARKGFGYLLANDKEGEHVLNRFNRWCDNRYRGQHVVIQVPEGEHQVTVRISSEVCDKASLLKNHTDIDANPEKYAESRIWIGRILLRGKPIEAHRIKGVPKLKQQLKWDEKLERYAQQDIKNPPADGVILFVGSSTIENWKTLSEDFPGKYVLNRGVSGTKTIDMVNYFEHLITPYNPSQIFLYPGDNDIGYKWTPEEIMEQVRKLFAMTREAKPDAEIVFISIKPSPRRMKDIDKIRETNALIREFAESQPNTRYADVFGAMLGEDGSLDPAYYREDGLHLTADGYKVWHDILAGYIR